MNINSINKSLRRLKRFEDIKDSTVFDGIYIPHGKHSSVNFSYNSRTNKISTVEYICENVSTVSDSPSEHQKRMFESIEEYKNTKSEANLVLTFHLVECSKDSTPELPEGNLNFKEFSYLWMVTVRDQEDMSDITYLPLSKWSHLSIVSGPSILLNGQDIDPQELNLKSIGNELLLSISTNNPFKRASRVKGPGKGMVHIPRKWSLLQRPESFWLYIQNNNYEV